LRFNRFECVLATVLHEDPIVVPQIIGFTNDMARLKFMPLMERDQGEARREVGEPTQKVVADAYANIEPMLREANFLDNYIVSVGNGGFRVTKTTTVEPKWSLEEWETGAVWRRGTAENVWAREYVKYPVECEDDLGTLELPDPDNPERYKGLEKALRYVRERGFFPKCDINGFFSGVWYFLRGPLHTILKDIYLRRQFFEKLLAKLGEFNLKAEKNLLERGAMMIGWVDDMGYNKGTFMSPKLYKELILPWHKRAIDLAHRHGAFVDMHSHGNINAIVPFLVKAKLDVLNPVGPSDNMDLKILKENYGDRLCLRGGLSKHVGFMNLDELKEHVMDRLRVGSIGGGFMLSSEGDLPYEMNPKNFVAFIMMSRRCRRNMPSS